MTFPKLAGTLRLLLLAALIACVACDPEPAANPPESPGEPPATTSTARADGIVEIPFPDLTQLEAAVQEQLLRGAEDLRTALARTDLDPVSKARHYGELGKIYHAYTLMDAAEACYRNAATSDPLQFAWVYYLGHVRRDLGRPEPSVHSFRSALAIEPENIPALIHLANLHLDDQNQPQLAEPLYTKARELDARCAAAIDGLGRIARGRGDTAAAVELYKEALALAPDASAIRYRLGMAYRKLGELDKAAEILLRGGSAKASVPDPLIGELGDIKTGMRVHANLGSEAYLAGDYEKAEAEFRKALEADPHHPLPRTNLGSILVYQNRIREAQKEFEEVIRLDPDSVQANFNLGTVLANSGADSRAMAHYRAALAVHPDHVDTHFNMANALRREGRFAEALGHYRKVLVQQPANATARCAEALTLAALQRYREAHESIETSFQALPDSAIIAHILARLLAANPEDDLRDGKRAVEVADAVLKAMRGAKQVSPGHVETMAMAHAQAGQFGLAIHFQQQAVSFVAPLAKPKGMQKRLEELRANLQRFTKKQTCRVPWRPGNTQVYPPRVHKYTLHPHSCPICEGKSP